MKITIIGGSKGTGARLATAASAACHEVTAVSRSGVPAAGARAIAADATNASAVREAISGADAVVVTVGGVKGSHHHRATVTRAVIEAMTASGVRRLVVQSSLGAGDSGSLMPAPLRVVMKLLLAAPLADHNEQEEAVRASTLDWTIVRPTGLTDKPAQRSWRALHVGDDGYLGGSIPRDDLAACILQLLDDDASIGTAVGVSS